MKSYCHMAPKR